MVNNVRNSLEYEDYKGSDTVKVEHSPLVLARGDHIEILVSCATTFSRYMGVFFMHKRGTAQYRNKGMKFRIYSTKRV